MRVNLALCEMSPTDWVVQDSLCTSATFAHPLRLHVSEAGVVALKCHSDHLRRAVSMLGNIEVRLAGTIGIPIVKIRSVEQDHHVGVLLEASRTREDQKASASCPCAARGHG